MYDGSGTQRRVPAVAGDQRSYYEGIVNALNGRAENPVPPMRRSELVALDVADCLFVPEGLVLRIRRAKSDQEGAGELRAVPAAKDVETCPVKAVKTWLIAAQLSEGPLFRPVDRFGRVGDERLDGRAVARTVKRAISVYGEAQGWPRQRIAQECRRVSGHSLRSGYATSAAKAGAAEWAIMRQTGHKRRESLQPYIRLGTLFRNATTIFDV